MSCFNLQAPTVLEVPTGMDRYFPFFLDIESNEADLTTCLFGINQKATKEPDSTDRASSSSDVNLATLNTVETSISKATSPLKLK